MRINQDLIVSPISTGYLSKKKKGVTPRKFREQINARGYSNKESTMAK